MTIISVDDYQKYKDYLLSDEWRAKAYEAKMLSGGRCRVCNSPENLNAHHRTYERLFDELSDDLTVLCQECHELYHQGGAPDYVLDILMMPENVRILKLRLIVIKNIVMSFANRLPEDFIVRVGNILGDIE